MNRFFAGEFVFAFAAFALILLNASSADSATWDLPRMRGEFRLLFGYLALDAWPDVDAVCAHAVRHQRMRLPETKRLRCLPEQASGALERRARLLLLLQALLAATKCIFAGPLRR